MPVVASPPLLRLHRNTPTPEQNKHAHTYTTQKNAHQRKRWEWFTVWFEAACLLSLLITAFLERSFKRGQAVFLAFFTLATQCVLLSAHNFITQVALGPLNTRDLGQDSVNAAAAGFVLLGVADFALLIVLGRDFGMPPGALLGAGGGAGQPYLGGPGGGVVQFQTSAPV